MQRRYNGTFSGAFQGACKKPDFRPAFWIQFEGNYIVRGGIDVLFIGDDAGIALRPIHQPTRMAGMIQ